MNNEPQKCVVVLLLAKLIANYVMSIVVKPITVLPVLFKTGTQTEARILAQISLIYDSLIYDSLIIPVLSSSDGYPLFKTCPFNKRAVIITLVRLFLYITM